MGADTGPADSTAIDSGPPTAATLSPTNSLGEEEETVAATAATSLGSTSLSSTVLGRCAFERV